MNVQRHANCVSLILPTFLHYRNVAERGLDSPLPSLEYREVCGGPVDQPT